NVLRHGVSGVLVYFLLRRLVALGVRSSAGSGGGGGDLAIACGLGALVFAVHPLRAESVAWVTERRDVLSAAFLLGATIAYLRSVRPGRSEIASRGAYLVSIVLLVLSCLSKAWGMTFFAIVLVLDWYPLGRISLAPRTWFTRGTVGVVAQKIPYIVVGVGTAIMAGIAQREGQAAKTLAEWGVQERLVQSLYGLWFYARATFFPDGLSPLYQLPVRIDPWEGRFVVAYVFVGAAVVAMLVLIRRLPALAAAGVVALILLSPVLGILQSGEQFVADRYSYLPAVAVSALVAGGAWPVLGRARRRAEAGRSDPLRLLIVAGGSIVVLALGVLTYAQTGFWRSTETLWGHAVEVSPGSQVLTNYAMELERQGRGSQADEFFLAATQLNPTDGRAWFTYGSRMRDEGKLKEAERAFKEAARYLPQAYQAYQNLGVMYAKHGHPEAAMEAFRLAVADVEKGGNRPLSGGPYMTLAFALEDAGKMDEAKATLRKALNFADTKADAEKELARLEAGGSGVQRGGASPGGGP
ncbi:MAG TPA: tetratricopeptide repeat protein, partial [Phycisphaerales bacterium]|nr:tetratricopeptide repeat protein [Phycisphaerales bacterium]